jgi:hypothetical protein
MALGARWAGVLGLAVWKGITLALIGLAIGLTASFGLTRLLRGSFSHAECYDVRPAARDTGRTIEPARQEESFA